MGELQKPGASEQKEPHCGMRRRSAMVLYFSGLFFLAFLAVLVSMLVQQRNSQATISDLIAGKDTAVAKAEQLQDENRNLNQQIRELENQRQDALQQQEEARQALAEVQSALEEQTRAGAAYELVLRAQAALEQEDTEQFKSLLDQAQKEKDFLGPAGQALLEELLAQKP